MEDNVELKTVSDDKLEDAIGGQDETRYSIDGNNPRCPTCDGPLWHESANMVMRADKWLCTGGGKFWCRDVWYRHWDGDYWTKEISDFEN